MIRTGLQVLLDEHIAKLKDMRIGVLANHASVTSDLTHISDALQQAGLNLTALFGPEHGIRGNAADGEGVADYLDSRLCVPVYSLYGAKTRPTPESLSNIDLMLIDLQDIGSRYYTFLFTMGEVMSACAQQGVPVWVLDRPNPISGMVTEGPILEPEYSYQSFDFTCAIPIRHGLTLGELARLSVRQCGIACNLRVIQMHDWTREMYYDVTTLPWVMPSPNMPTLDTAIVYPGTCLFEGTNVSEGRGTTRPFEIIGAPWIDSFKLKTMLNVYDLPGVAFREAFFIPRQSKFQGTPCTGLQLHVTDRNEFRPVQTAIIMLCLIHKLHPQEFAFLEPRPGAKHFFDVLAGCSFIREGIESGASPEDIMAHRQPQLANFAHACSEICIY